MNKELEVLKKLEFLDYIGCCNGNTNKNQREYKTLINELKQSLTPQHITKEEIIQQMEDSLSEGETFNYIVSEAVREIDNIDRCNVSDYEFKAFTLNVIQQCKNFIKTCFDKRGETDGQ